MQYFSTSRAHTRTVHKTVDGENPMDFVVKKIEELDISRYHTKGHYRKLGSPKNDTTDDLTDNTRTAERGCESQVQVQSKAIETTPSRLNPSLSDLLSRLGTTNLGSGQHPASRPADPHQDTMVHSYSLNLDTQTLAGCNSLTGADPHPQPPQTMYYHQRSDSQRSLCGEVDPLFIHTVTAAELVCGESKYRCSGCLRYYDHLGTLLGHIDQGWSEGFSCRVFYRKLKSMQDRSPMVMMSCQSKEARALDIDPKHSSSSIIRLGSASLALAHHPTDVDGRNGPETRDKKADMIHKWLQKTEVTSLLH
ncbi:spermatogenesis-associated protein 46 [Salmo trutta]|uniref:spermatogenesis-associated protein 46 n=1 Tax=Salmo trutta TaxID=8032 RepID=UPI001130C7F4|nr:spermatogenesis-associated protein 46 [Salmo trutta]